MVYAVSYEGPPDTVAFYDKQMGRRARECNGRFGNKRVFTEDYF